MISIIVAVADNGVIGCANKLIWHLSDDLKRFKRLTTGHPVVMGRKTFDSIGRPLPNRVNIVVSRDESLDIEDVVVVNSIDGAVGLFGTDEEIFIIGGGEIYRQSMPLADKLYLTLVHQTPEGDTYFPEIDHGQWKEVFREVHKGYEFVDFIRI
ncbi:Dihydrofolate reductase [Mucinivorans hirudinis]|uniref:Dihydrofolate reductase n=1 Tax=Mucinivorans hirudinis TaxID=1433126 RepID=A0A060RBY6_9BACT|nr:Dihydrofolate reductase [Mucinivorans hirudinis]